VGVCKRTEKETLYSPYLDGGAIVEGEHLAAFRLKDETRNMHLRGKGCAWVLVEFDYPDEQVAGRDVQEAATGQR
jgi:hypothetical protein